MTLMAGSSVFAALMGQLPTIPGFEDSEWATWILFLFFGFPLGWIGYGLVAYLFYSAIYGFCVHHFAGPVYAVIVLGAGCPTEGATLCLLRVFSEGASCLWAPCTLCGGDQFLSRFSGSASQALGRDARLRHWRAHGSLLHAQCSFA